MDPSAPPKAFVGGAFWFCAAARRRLSLFAGAAAVGLDASGVGCPSALRLSPATAGCAGLAGEDSSVGGSQLCFPFLELNLQ
mgnify:CR=1 FL=1|jgi:hypothetical protein